MEYHVFLTLESNVFPQVLLVALWIAELIKHLVIVVILPISSHLNITVIHSRLRRYRCAWQLDLISHCISLQRLFQIINVTLSGRVVHPHLWLLLTHDLSLDLISMSQSGLILLCLNTLFIQFSS